MPTNAPFIVFTSPDPSSDDAKPEDPVALQLCTLYCDEVSGHTQRLKAIEDLAKGLGLSLEDLHGSRKRKQEAAEIPSSPPRRRSSRLIHVAPRITSKSSELPAAYHIKQEDSALPVPCQIKHESFALPPYLLVPNTPVRNAFTDTILAFHNEWDTNDLTLSPYISSSVSRVPETESGCVTASCGIGGFLMRSASESE